MIQSAEPALIEIETYWAGLKSLEFDPFNVIFPYYAMLDGKMRLAHLVLLSHEGKLLLEIGEGYSFPRQQTAITEKTFADYKPILHKHFETAPTVTFNARATSITLLNLTHSRSWLMDTTWFDIRQIAADYNGWDAPETIDNTRRKMDLTRPNIKSGERDQGKDAYGYAHLLLYIANKLLMYRY